MPKSKRARTFKFCLLLATWILVLMKKCELIITDSGGIQEEATAPCIRKPIIVIRLSTERPEALEAGFAKVAGTEKSGILSAIEATLASRRQLPSASPFGDGKAAEKIAEIIKTFS
ncbi:MAG: UDP-N-acetyl glucosamine 2-epimerase [Candidatus Bathyarchaeota archaeon]|nr:UDP-N-acetyl glucosamine 2-epimerase [Candidatus Bathyarchaeota archaeon]